VKMFDADKPRMTALLYVEKTVIPDRQTDGQNRYINMTRQCAYAR